MVATTIFVIKLVQNCLVAPFKDVSAGSAKTYSASSSAVFLFRIESNKEKSESVFANGRESKAMPQWVGIGELDPGFLRDVNALLSRSYARRLGRSQSKGQNYFSSDKALNHTHMSLYFTGGLQK